MLPLEGVTVVALEQAVAVPFATRQLADLGARVIKIERPSGDFARAYDATVKGLSSHFVWLNRSKESVVLDLKTSADQRRLDALLGKADVFVQNLAPGAAERLGFGSERLIEEYPRLIVGDLSGYGGSGPYQQKKAYDLLVQCEAGVVSITGTEAEQAKAGIPVADIAGGMYVYSGILAALYERERTGRGSRFEVSLFDALGEWMGYPYYYGNYGGSPPARTGARHPAIAPYGPFTTGDGAQVFLAVQNEREWATLCEGVLGRGELVDDERFADNPRRVAHQDQLAEVIESAFASRTAEEVLARLDEAGIANAQLRDVAGFAAHPQLAARDRWRTVDSEAGPLRALRPPVTMPGREPRMGAIPRLGEHTEAVLAEVADD
ncbi:crotonobetainyl-CoA:carnitine CoA-transferase CaiB-like acyl-CoA transferase [Tamaricihabitans halophyticus]|uniref:Crotonobetainyl-CoA:carnitine CoA-transferase CaiB-like acyl-CoA transferase n=1 Tax=Tamaricihabitans halophyticus TaxID=1262583 RepID=A0A4R2QMT1_9PSEU|nr:CaiB/BaiF CoA-transferase family protein [Tamaricihabitans halophyticus]TCP50883.1 crotonobetainyl-CoA:carnitine CoA-transferase CaiB-like acyl-CoA transferase [Tamaricihabitans halophyticus]